MDSGRCKILGSVALILVLSPNPSYAEIPTTLRVNQSKNKRSQQWKCVIVIISVLLNTIQTIIERYDIAHLAKFSRKMYGWTPIFDSSISSW
jgi:hypothetical protein